MHGAGAQSTAARSNPPKGWPLRGLLHRLRLKQGRGLGLQGGDRASNGGDRQSVGKGCSIRFALQTQVGAFSLETLKGTEGVILHINVDSLYKRKAWAQL